MVGISVSGGNKALPQSKNVHGELVIQATKSCGHSSMLELPLRPSRSRSPLYWVLSAAKRCYTISESTIRNTPSRSVVDEARVNKMEFVEDHDSCNPTHVAQKTKPN
jgi:hypothetical protein